MPYIQIGRENMRVKERHGKYNIDPNQISRVEKYNHTKNTLGWLITH